MSVAVAYQRTTRPRSSRSGLAIRSEYGNKLRNHVDDRPKLRFGLSHFGQGFGQRRLRTIPLDGDERDVLGLLE